MKIAWIELNGIRYYRKSLFITEKPDDITKNIYYLIYPYNNSETKNLLPNKFSYYRFLSDITENTKLKKTPPIQKGGVFSLELIHAVSKDSLGY